MSSFLSNIKRGAAAGTAHEGAHHWVAQRLSSLAVLVLGVWFVVILFVNASFDHAAWQNFFIQPLNALLLTLFVVSTVYHSALGLQVVIEDYVTSPAWRVGSLIFVKALSWLLMAVAIMSMMSLVVRSVV